MVSKHRAEEPGLGAAACPLHPPVPGMCVEAAAGPKEGKGTGPKIQAEGKGKEPGKGGRRLYKAVQGSTSPSAPI